MPRTILKGRRAGRRSHSECTNTSMRKSRGQFLMPEGGQEVKVNYVIDVFSVFDM